MFSLDGEMDEIMGHAYLFLKEQLEISTMPPPSGIVHGTIIGAVIFSFFPYPTPRPLFLLSESLADKVLDVMKNLLCVLIFETLVLMMTR